MQIVWIFQGSKPVLFKRNTEFLNAQLYRSSISQHMKKPGNVEKEFDYILQGVRITVF